MPPEHSALSTTVTPMSTRMWATSAMAMLAWGTLAFGAVYPWAHWPLLVGALTVGALGHRMTRGSRDGAPDRALCLMLGVVALATALQTVPLPPTFLSRLSPAGDAFFPVGSTLGARRALSIDPQSTGVALGWLVALAVLFVGSTRALRRSGVVSVTRGLVGLGALVSLTGIVSASTSSRAIYGFWPPRYDAAPFGPFVNENHFAGWMIMVLPLTIGYLCAVAVSGGRSIRRGPRRGILWLSTPTANELSLVTVCATLMAGALVLTLSRSGIVCLAIALLLLGGFALRQQRARMGQALSVGVIAGVGLVAIGWAGVDAVTQEFGGVGVTLNGRLDAWREALRIVHDFPITGTGLQTYGTATLLYATNDSVRFTHAHNDYVQFAAEGGFLVGFPALLAAGLFLREVHRRFRAGEDDGMTRWVRIGALTGLAAMALQETVEFSLQIPGNAALFTLLAALAAHRPGGGSRVSDAPARRGGTSRHSTEMAMFPQPG